MGQISVIRLMLAEAAFAGYFIGLCDGLENAVPALAASLGLGGIVLFGKKKDCGPAFRVAVALVVGMVVGSYLLGPRYYCNAPFEPSAEIAAALVGGLPCAFGCSRWINANRS